MVERISRPLKYIRWDDTPPFEGEALAYGDDRAYPDTDISGPYDPDQAYETDDDEGAPYSDGSGSGAVGFSGADQYADDDDLYDDEEEEDDLLEDDDPDGDPRYAAPLDEEDDDGEADDYDDYDDEEDYDEAGYDAVAEEPLADPREEHPVAQGEVQAQAQEEGEDFAPSNDVADGPAEPSAWSILGRALGEALAAPDADPRPQAASALDEHDAANDLAPGLDDASGGVGDNQPGAANGHDLASDFGGVADVRNASIRGAGYRTNGRYPAPAGESEDTMDAGWDTRDPADAQTTHDADPDRTYTAPLAADEPQATETADGSEPALHTDHRSRPMTDDQLDHGSAASLPSNTAPAGSQEQAGYSRMSAQRWEDFDGTRAAVGEDLEVDKTIRAYQSYIEDTLDLFDLTKDTIEKCDLENYRFEATKIESELQPLRNQLRRLERNEFVVVVAGMESYGKSTFLNAWLEDDFLPSADARTTFSITKLYSTTGEQCFDVEFWSERDFNKFLHDLEDEFRKTEDDRLQEDLKFIKANEEGIRQYVGRSVLTEEFDDLANARDKIRAFITDKERAYAVKEIRIYSQRVTQQRNILLFDLPGLDSGLRLHRRDNETMLADCDAIILIQEASKPSVKGFEKDLAHYIKLGEYNIPPAEKIFVFFNKIDTLFTSRNLENNVAEARQSWLEDAGLSIDRFFPGSALAHLATVAGLSEETLADKGDLSTEQLQKNLLKTVLTDEQFAEVVGDKRMDLSQLVLRYSGIEGIRTAVETFIRSERLPLLQRRCNPTIRKVWRFAKDVRTAALGMGFSENVEDAREIRKSRDKEELIKWSSTYLDDMYEEGVNRVYLEALNPYHSEEQLFDRYKDILASKVDIGQIVADTAKTVFGQHKLPVVRTEEANIDWRRKLSNVLREHVSSLGDDIAAVIFDDLMHVVDDISSRLFGDARVERALIGSRPLYRDKLKAAVNALIKRHALVLIELLIAHPREFSPRKQYANILQRDIRALCCFREENVADTMAGVSSSSREHTQSVLTCAMLLLRENFQDEPADIFDEKAIDLGLDLSLEKFCVLPRPEVPDNYPSNRADLKRFGFQPVLKEVMEDLLFMNRLLRTDVYYASGIAEFRNQEFRRLLEEFLSEEKRDAWRAVIHDAFERRDMKLAEFGFPKELLVSNGEYASETSLMALRGFLETKDEHNFLTV